jgi:hypothetical protein
VQISAASRNGGVDREDPLDEGGQHLRLQPAAQHRTRVIVTALALGIFPVQRSSDRSGSTCPVQALPGERRCRSAPSSASEFRPIDRCRTGKADLRIDDASPLATAWVIS